MIKLNNINKIYTYKRNEIHALKDINLEIQKNEFVIVVGPSGSGKSTLLNIIGGLIKPTLGEYYFDNKLLDVEENYLSQFRLDHIGYILQNFSLISDKNIYYNISLPLLYKKVGKEKIRDKVSTLCAIMNISDKLGMKPSMLSRGEQQRAAIARAIIADPDIILADEPTSSLDDDNKTVIMDILQDLHSIGKTIIVATHDKQIIKNEYRVIHLQENMLHEMHK